MRAPVVRRLARVLEERLSGKTLRYILARRGAAEDEESYLLRMEEPAGTVLVSLRRGMPWVAVFDEGESPEGEKGSGAEKLGAILEGRRVTSVTAEAVDRFLTFEWEGEVTMRIDLRPGRPALIVAEKGTVRFAVSAGGGPGGRTGPGGAMPPVPGAEKPDLLRFDTDEIPGEPGGDDEVRRFFRGAVRSLPKEWIDELLFRARFDEIDETEKQDALAAVWREMIGEFRDGHGVFLYRESDRSDLSAIRLGSTDEEGRFFADPAAGAAACWRALAEEGRAGEIVALIRATAGRERKRLRRLLSKLEGELAGAERFPLYRRQGEILSIHFGGIEKGTRSVTLPDPYDGGEIEIGLDETKTPRENIDRLFKLARKGERATPLIRERIDETAVKLAALDNLLDRADRVSGGDEAEALREMAAPLVREKPREPEWRGKVRRKKDRDLKVRPREYTVTGGYTVLVGRDNKENDLLTLRIARPWDLWFHAGQSAGSHVVLLRENQKKPVPGEALLEAAAIAAWHSKARHGSKVAVIYTEKRYVRKPKGSPPGRVTCTREKTLFVDPGVPDQS